MQKNANSIQAEIEKALSTLFRQEYRLTGSSRTDAGVHALQNYFHFDMSDAMLNPNKQVYHLNAILPEDIVVKRIVEVGENAHCRFDADSREYNYYISQEKDPFQRDRAYFFPYKLDIGVLNEAASLIMCYVDFTSFSKRNTQVKSFICTIYSSEWKMTKNGITYTVQGNRFLRGMVRGLVGTMLQVGRQAITIAEFKQIIEGKDCSKAKFDVPAAGLFLSKVLFPKNIFISAGDP